MAELPDPRGAPDRYLSLDADRAKALAVAYFEDNCDVLGLARVYDARTADVDAARRSRYLAHIAHAEARGEALAALLPRAGRILEVGCGTGGLLVAAARRGLEVCGVDVALRWLVLARRRLRDRGLTVPLIGASVERLPWADGTFDALVADSLLEHLGDPAAALHECRRVLKPGGRLLAWSPNRFAIAPDPHCGLWEPGWLPHAWGGRYVRWRRGCEWPVRPLSAARAAQIAGASGFNGVTCEPPAIPEAWAGGRAGRIMLRAYGRALASRIARRPLRLVGPLWELRARREEAA